MLDDIVENILAYLASIDLILTFQPSNSQKISRISTYQSSPRIADMCQIEQPQVADVKSVIIFTPSPLDLSLARNCTEFSAPPSLSTLVGCTLDTLALRANCIHFPLHIEPRPKLLNFLASTN